MDVHYVLKKIIIMVGWFRSGLTALRSNTLLVASASRLSWLFLVSRDGGKYFIGAHAAWGRTGGLSWGKQKRVDIVLGEREQSAAVHAALI